MGQKAKTYDVSGEQVDFSGAQIISLEPYAARQQAQIELASRGEAVKQLAKYVFHHYRVRREDLEALKPDAVTATSLLWGAKAVVSPESTVNYLVPDIEAYDLSSSREGRGLLALIVNQNSVHTISTSSDTLPWLQELSDFLATPVTHDVTDELQQTPIAIDRPLHLHVV